MKRLTERLRGQFSDRLQNTQTREIEILNTVVLADLMLLIAMNYIFFESTGPNLKNAEIPKGKD